MELVGTITILLEYLGTWAVVVPGLGYMAEETASSGNIMVAFPLIDPAYARGHEGTSWVPNFCHSLGNKVSTTLLDVSQGSMVHLWY